MDRAGMGQMLMSEAKIEFPKVDGNLQLSCPRLRMQVRPEAVVEVLR
jgi:hypothetical protein